MKPVLFAAALTAFVSTAALAQEGPDAHAAHEANLRAIIAWSQGDEAAFGYDRFSPELAEVARARAGEMSALLQGFGAVQTVTHQGEAQGGTQGGTQGGIQGAQQFRVEFENAATNWSIALNDEGKVTGLTTQPAQ